ncbi:glycosyltransferase family 4 protein [Alicyclobacillus macrosporangiidus]|uniref:1,4-alpha-glucan branching enzyme/glycogen(Starch) synthase n=1 Tax=Alicyclobacillus macrosporangiidus TaxID=392015 RepID=A0A1I7JQQ7_9BACL|nr:glycosyltransferase family 4 protein [Alicyclobacillus macrosporangiidus]SFU87446.1 1,4-alpha-glucan branching enzyme/glycogen(starch) synthase [Alicyclobacillus macrosporangiidus]
MRVWVFTFEYGPSIIGGLGVVATRLSQALADLGHEVTVFARAGGQPGITHDAGLTVIRLPARAPFYLRRRRRYKIHPVADLAAELGLSRPDVIHVHSVPFTNVALHLGRVHGAPVFYTCHSLVREEPKSPLRNLVMRQQERLLTECDCVIVPSGWQWRTLESAYPACAGRVRVIANGVDLPEGIRLATAAMDAERARRDRLRLLFVGRLVAGKGVQSLLKAVAILRRRGLPVQLDVVGRGSQAYTKHLRETARRLGVAKRVRWLGFREPSAMPQVYLAHDVVVVPSRQESFGLVALEAMAWGVPLVSTRSGGLADFVDPQVAEVIPRTTGLAVANAVQRIVRQPGAALSYVEEARRRAEDYTWHRVAKRYAALFAKFCPRTNLG